MKTLAAVLVESAKPLVLAELEIPKLKRGQTIVAIERTGVCHTQLLEARGLRGPDRFLPHCLGHEGFGTVLETGEGVLKVRVGDKVLLSWMKGGGIEGGGVVYSWDGKPVNAGPVATFASHAVVSENRLTPLPKGLEPDAAAILGCAVATGMGAVLNTAQPRAGQSVAVLGAGGVGLCAIAAAALSGCSPVVAVDKRQDRLDAARDMGATHGLLADGRDLRPEAAKILPQGFDFVFEATGRPELMRLALEFARERGGAGVVIGNAPFGASLELDPRQFNMGKRLLGTWGGDNQPDGDFPRYADLIARGKVRLAPMLGRDYPLAKINEALADLEGGGAVRPILVPGSD